MKKVPNLPLNCVKLLCKHNSNNNNNNNNNNKSGNYGNKS